MGPRYHIQFYRKPTRKDSNIGRHVNRYPLVYGHFIRDVVFPFVLFMSNKPPDAQFVIVEQTRHFTYSLFSEIFPTKNITIVRHTQHAITKVQKGHYYSVELQHARDQQEVFYERGLSTLIDYRRALPQSMVPAAIGDHKTIFINRKPKNGNATHSDRRYVNIGQYIRSVQESAPDLSVLYMEDLPFSRQVQILHYAETIYLGYGSECFNLFLCQKLRHVYEHTPNIDALGTCTEEEPSTSH